MSSDQKKFEKNIFQPQPRNRSKSKFCLNRVKPKYLTDNQISSSDHTQKSLNENYILLNTQIKVKRLQKQNFQLKQMIIKLKASQFYELDQQRIRNVIRNNEFLKLKVYQLQQNLELAQSNITELEVQNQYLKRNNKNVMEQYQQVIKQNVRQKHQAHKYNLSHAFTPQTLPHTLSQQEQNNQNRGQNKLLSQKVSIDHIINSEVSTKPKQKQSQGGRTKSRYRSTSKSSEKSGMLFQSKRKAVKRAIQSTSESQNLKSSSSKLLTFGHQKFSRSKELKSSKIVTENIVKQDQYQDVYYTNKKDTRQQNSPTNKKKKCLYYS